MLFMTLDYYEISQNLSFSILDPEFFWLHPEFWGFNLSFSDKVDPKGIFLIINSVVYSDD